MIIKDINIISFGKLKNKKIALSESLNVIYGKNESGKTTVSSFIEAMLYSFPPRSDRAKYLPWDASPAAGEMTIATPKGDISLYRRFGPTPKGDVLEPKDFPPEGLIPPDRESYRKSIYSKEGMASDFGTTSNIDKRISNLITSGEESSGVNDAIKNLEKLRRSLNSGNKLKELENKISLLENEYSHARGEQIRTACTKEEISEKRKVLKAMEQKAREAEKALNHSRKTKLEELEGSIRVQSEYIASFPECSAPLAKPPLLNTSLIFYIICSLAVFIACFFIRPVLSPFALLPLVIYAAVYFTKFIKYKKAAKSFLAKAGCSSFEEYDSMCMELLSAKEYYHALLKEKSDLVSLSAIAPAHNIYKDILSLKTEIEALEASVTTQSRDLTVIKEELDYTRSLRLDLSKKLEAVRVALEGFNHAKASIATDFIPKVTEKAMEYLNLIAPKDGRLVKLSEDMSLFVSDPIRQEIGAYSFGFREEMYICFRIAWAEYLYGEDFPLIFDDPFLGSDDYREKALIDLFYALSKKRQVIIFTNRKNDYFKQLKCNWVDISPTNDV